MTDDENRIPFENGWELPPPAEEPLPELPALFEVPELALPASPDQSVPPAAPSLLGLCPIESVSIQGRGWRKPYTAYSIGEWGVTLQFSDSQNHEIWAQVVLSQEVLGEMIYAVLAQHEYTDAMTRECVKVLVMKLPK